MEVLEAQNAQLQAENETLRRAPGLKTELHGRGVLLAVLLVFAFVALPGVGLLSQTLGTSSLMSRAAPVSNSAIAWQGRTLKSSHLLSYSGAESPAQSKTPIYPLGQPAAAPSGQLPPRPIVGRRLVCRP